MWAPLRSNPVAAGILGVLVLGGLALLAGRLFDDAGVSRRLQRLQGEYRGTYAGNCVALLLLQRGGEAEYRDGCDGELELRAVGTWVLRGKVVRFAWRDEPEEWARQKRRGRLSTSDGRYVIELDFVRLEKLTPRDAPP